MSKHMYLMGAVCAAALQLKAYGQAQPVTIDPAAIDAVFEDYQSDTAPGCAVGVYADQSLQYAKGYGMANLDWGAPITPQTNFYLGSVGKQFTAAIVLHAARAGHLSLDDTVQTWAPELPEYDAPITVQHLIDHTSGLRDYIQLIYLSGSEIEGIWPEQKTLDLITRQHSANFPAGEQFSYSNSGYFLLSVILERATGLSLSEYAQQHVFQPLGMTDSRVHDDRHAPMPRRATGYEGAASISNTENFELVGSGGVYSSIEDLLHWDNNFYTQAVGGDGFTAALTERGLLSDGSQTDYAFGLFHGAYRGQETLYHSGALLGFRAMLVRFPAQETAIAVLCNTTARAGSLAYQVADSVLAAHLDPEPQPEPVVDTPAETPEAAAPSAPVTLTQSQLEAYAGLWMNPQEVAFNIQPVNGALEIDYYGDAITMTPRSATAFEVDHFGADFVFSELEDGQYQQMQVMRGDRTLLTSTRVAPQTPPASITGVYFSDELNALYTLDVTEGLLRIGPAGGAQSPAYPVGPDNRYSLISSSIALHTEGDAVTGFVLDAGRVQGITFVKQ